MLLCKSFDFKAAKVDREKRIIAGYAATWTEDSGGDTIIPGAFLGTIKRRGPYTDDEGRQRSKIKVGFNHGPVVGLPLRMEEDEKGLYTESRIDPTQQGEECLIRVESGSLDQMSFQYDVLLSEKNGGGRLLKELEAYEYGPVDYAMNEAADILGLKSRRERALLSRLDWKSLAAIMRELKAGRVISRRNLEKLESALEALQAVRDAASYTEDVEDEDETEEEDEKSMNLEKGLQDLLDQVQSANRSLSARKSDDKPEDEDEEKTDSEDEEDDDEEDEEEEEPPKSRGPRGKKNFRPGAEQKRHPKTADICARLTAASYTLEPYSYCCYGTTPSNEAPDQVIIDGVVDILEDIVNQLRALGGSTPAAE